MFMGEFQHNIDAKGRVIVPSRFRDDLGDNFVITRGLDKCIFVYPLDRWQALVEKLKTLPWTSNEVRRFTRFFLAGAAECEVDAQGRIVIPQNLREHAGLEKQITSIGAGDRVEIWSRDMWDEYNSGQNYDDNEMAEKMSDFWL